MGAGYFLEFLLGRVFRNYSKDFGNIGKYTSLKIMLIWGLSSLGVIYFIVPKTDKYIKKNTKSNYLHFSIFIYH